VGQFVVCFSNEELFQLTPTHSTQIVMKGENNPRVVEVVKIDRRGYSSFCFFFTSCWRSFLKQIHYCQEIARRMFWKEGLLYWHQHKLMNLGSKQRSMAFHFTVLMVWLHILRKDYHFNISVGNKLAGYLVTLYLMHAYCAALVKELDWLPKGCRFETHKVNEP